MIRRYILYVLLFACIALPSASAAGAADATAWQRGDSAYVKKDYKQAAQFYEQQLKTGVNAVVYYNLGNAYYRLNDIPKAILNYERALKIAPEYENAAYNLSVCRSKSNISVENSSEMFFITWVDNLIRSHSPDTWGIWALICFAVILCSGIIFRIATRLVLRKCTFALSCIMTVIFACCLSFAATQNHRYLHERKAVVMIETALTSEAGRVTSLRLMPGTTVRIVDKNADGKVLVELLSGDERGWISDSSLVEV